MKAFLFLSRRYAGSLFTKVFLLGFMLEVSTLSVQAQEATQSMMQDISYPYLEKLIEIAKANYPRSKSFKERVGIADLGIRRAKVAYFDALSVSYLYSPANTPTYITNPTSPVPTVVNPNWFNNYQIGLLLNIGSMLQKTPLLKQARGEKKVAEYEQQAFDLNLEADVKQRYFAYIQRRAVLRVKHELQLDIESMLKDVKYKFEKGEQSLENYNNVLVMYSDNNQQLIIAESEVLISKTRLEELVGEKLENIKLDQ